MWWLVLIAAALVFGRKKEVMAVAIKSGVSGTIRDEMKPAVEVVQLVWRKYNLPIPTITSIEDGEHKAGSLHYVGLAHDYRLNNAPAHLHDSLREEVAGLLGKQFDVLHEFHGETRDHLHIEFDPPKGV